MMAASSPLSREIRPLTILLLVAHLPEAFLPFMRGHFFPETFLAAGHQMLLEYVAIMMR
jgi:hypothetical protein